MKTKLYLKIFKQLIQTNFLPLFIYSQTFIIISLCFFFGFSFIFNIHNQILINQFAIIFLWLIINFVNLYTDINFFKLFWDNDTWFYITITQKKQIFNKLFKFHFLINFLYICFLYIIILIPLYLFLFNFNISFINLKLLILIILGIYILFSFNIYYYIIKLYSHTISNIIFICFITFQLPIFLTLNLLFENSIITNEITPIFLILSSSTFFFLTIINFIIVPKFFNIIIKL